MFEAVFTCAGRRLRKQGRLHGDAAKIGSRNAAGAIQRVDFRQRVLVVASHCCRFEPRDECRDESAVSRRDSDRVRAEVAFPAGSARSRRPAHVNTLREALEEEQRFPILW